MADDSEGDNGIVDEYDNDKNIDSSQKLNDARKFIKQHTRHIKVTISPTFCEQNPEDERVLQDDQRCLAHWCEKV